MAQLRTERVCRAYRDVFGDNEKTRSQSQQIVWDDLQIAGFAKTTTQIADKEGRLCAMRTAGNEGRRWMLLYIELNVSFKPELAQPKQQ